MEKADIGLIGLAVMGQNLVLNMENKGFTVVVFNRTTEKTKNFTESKCKDRKIIPAYSLKEFVNSLSKPRKIVIMVKAGNPVDDMINSLLEYLENGDVVIDGGNSYFKDTNRRFAGLKEKGIDFIGAGISGGEYGALHGPSIMPGCEYDAYKKVEKILLKISAQTDDGACCTYLGKNSAGHFVKMVHNGIEYGIMQILAEVYDIMKNGLQMKNGEIQKVFTNWNSDKLNSYLVEISAEVLKKIDKDTRKPLVELILDTAAQKGTGKWTSQVSFDLGVAVPTITNAVNARIISGYKKERVEISKILKRQVKKINIKNKKKCLIQLENACYAAILITYAQGMHLLKIASDEMKYELNLSEVARIWKGGCIIRSNILNILKETYSKNPNLTHLFLDKGFVKILKTHIGDLNEIICASRKSGIITMCMSASLDYYDSFSRANLPTNLIQAQRDYFGAHTYERIDKKGIFHTEWTEE
jgi:6-phosphogluconate dehydrogenase